MARFREDIDTASNINKEDKMSDLFRPLGRHPFGGNGPYSVAQFKNI
jgi:hypothetical protein